ncbi:serine/threonine-protein kinase [Actinokineospora spheciospongiae]|uniref:serine/threonine-protein kinase n=1 Tax=Actinokineospora spheciospongiae TaxID=909613 RepID=UPI000D710294|nr:serine/threonine-protein kinase [Actinokineospora spheciospongiae]PWW64428.1 serine/threonine protein kinase [Actinokineospora spheciospongiae]
MHTVPPVIPGLTLGRPLGQGGFGTVFLARQDRLERDVAVKVDNRVLGTERDRERFLREARAAARLSGHPNVVNVYDAGVTADGRPYIVMELCTGGSLADVLERQGALAYARVVEIGARLADALAHAHAVGILHRDIKPANILVNAFGAVKLADFGLASVLDAHADSVTVTVGALSPHYAAPEVFAHAAPSRAGDVYSLGATLYTLATGRRPRQIPWPADSLDGLVSALRAPVPPIEGAPPALNAALLNALDADADRRTPGAEQLRDELEGLRAVRPLPPVVAPARRRWLLVVAVVAVPVLVAAGFFWRGLLDPGQGTQGAGQTGQTGQTSAAPRVPKGMVECSGEGFCLVDKCFGGLVNLADVDIKAAPADCSGEHAWQAYAGTFRPEGSEDLTATAIAALPEVARVCSAEVMAARTALGRSTAGWKREVMPTDETVLCLAAPESGEPDGSVFTNR